MIRTYRCSCGWSARRKGDANSLIPCDDCEKYAAAVDPKPGRPKHPPEKQRVDLHCRPLAWALEMVGTEQARGIAARAVERAARNAKARRA